MREKETEIVNEGRNREGRKKLRTSRRGARRKKERERNEGGERGEKKRRERETERKERIVLSFSPFRSVERS